jgi:hypothetical protein
MSDDAVNAAMIDGLRSQLRHELKETLMPALEAEVDAVIERLCARIEMNFSSEQFISMFGDRQARITS